MLTLYYKPTCVFSQRVISEAEALGLTLNLKNISADAVLKDELVEKTGKTRIPFLEDSERGVSMHESADIIAYLEKEYNAEGNDEGREFNGLRVRKGEDVCEACE